MAEAPRDQNHVPTLLAVSNVDGTTPVTLYADPVTHRLLVDLAAGSGTVTEVSVVSANGFAGTVADATTTPAITLTTTITGILKGNGTAISAAAAGTDYSALAFSTIAVSGQSNVVADSPADTLTLVAGTNITITTDAGADSITINASGGGSVSFGSDNQVPFTNATTDDFDYSANFTFDGTNLVVTTGGIAMAGLVGIDYNPGSDADTDIITVGVTDSPRVFWDESQDKLSSTKGWEFGATISPTANDGAALGTASLSFSDLFLASGAVVNIANGDWVATHTAGILTVGTGDLRVTTAGTNAASVVTVGGTQTLTSKSLTSPSVTTATLNGANVLAESASIQLDPALSADGTFTGITRTGTAGATLAFGDLIYLDPTDSRWELADANAASGADGDSRGVLGICVLAAAADGDPTTILLFGNVRADTAFPAMTINAPMYVSETAGDITGTQPTTTDVVIRIVGHANTADELFFHPDNTWITHT